VESGAPICSSISKSQLWYSQRVKNNIGKQLNKNKKLMAEVVADNPVVGVEGYSEVVLDAMESTPTLGLTFRGDMQSLLNLFSVTEEDRYREEGVSVSNTFKKEGVQKFRMLH
jgi:hypothetical protein